MFRGTRKILLVVLASVTVASGQRARGDEWSPTKPKSAPTGAAVSWKRSPGDAAHLPRARVVTRQVHAWVNKKQDLAIEFDSTTTPAKSDDKGRAQVDVAVELTGFAVDQEDLMPTARAKGGKLSVLSALDAHGFVAQGTPKGAMADGKLAEALKPVGSWVLPYLPEKPVRVGEAWDLPIPYFLWTVDQSGGVPAEGFVTQVLEAIEVHAGVRCARVKTVAALKRPQPKGMTPAAVEIGEGAALARLHAEGTMWIDLDGVLREDALDLKLRVENNDSKAWMEWTFHREVKAQPMGAAPAARDWSGHMGGLKFVVGYEKGMDAAWAAGRPAMLFFTSIKDHWCPLFAARTWKDKEVLEKVKAYIPVLVDADADPELAKRLTVVLLPGVVWVDSEGGQLFSAIGDAPIEMFRALAETARDRAPDVGPSPSLVASRKAADALHAALKAGDTKAALKAIRDVGEVKRPATLVAEAKAAEEQIGKRGAEELASAKSLLEAGKKAEAKEALQKVRQSYGDHPVGQEAWMLLRKLNEEEK